MGDSVDAYRRERQEVRGFEGSRVRGFGGSRVRRLLVPSVPTSGTSSSAHPRPQSPVPSPQSRVPSPESRVPSPESRVPEAPYFLSGGLSAGLSGAFDSER